MLGTRARQKAAEKVRDVAAELLDVYAQRAVKSGFAFKLDKRTISHFPAKASPFWKPHTRSRDGD